MRHELAEAAKQRNLYNHGRLSPAAGEPRYLQTAIFERWSLKTAEELRWIDAIESILTPSTAVLTAHLCAEDRPEAIVKINYGRMEKIVDTCLLINSARSSRFPGMARPMGFDCALTLLRLSADRGLPLSSSKSFRWALGLYEEPSFLLAVAPNYPEFLRYIDVSVINETYLVPQAKQHYVFREEKSLNIQDHDAFVFDGVFEKILMKGMQNYPQEMGYNWSLLENICDTQQEVARIALEKSMSTSEAAIWAGQQEERLNDRSQILATRALTIDLDLLWPAIGLPKKNVRAYFEAESHLRWIAYQNAIRGGWRSATGR